MSDEWNKTSCPTPYEMVEILMKDGKIHTDMMVKAKYGNLTWRNWDDKEVVGWRKQNQNLIKGNTAYKVRGIFCLNSKCKHYFEDNCMLILETDTVHISGEGNCEDFEAGRHLGYADESALKSAT